MVFAWFFSLMTSFLADTSARGSARLPKAIRIAAALTCGAERLGERLSRLGHGRELLFKTGTRALIERTQLADQMKLVRIQPFELAEDRLFDLAAEEFGRRDAIHFKDLEELQELHRLHAGTAFEGGEALHANPGFLSDFLLGEAGETTQLTKLEDDIHLSPPPLRPRRSRSRP